MSNWHYKIIIFLGLLAVAWQPALACDPCSLYCSAKVKDIKAGTWTASISNQYSSFKKPKGYLENSQQNGESVTGFSTAQLALGYDLTDRFALQIAVPVIARSYEKFSNYRKSTATDYGLGDITIAASYMPWRLQKDSLTVSWSVFSGLELPTGKTGELNEVESNISERFSSRHHSISGTSGGRALVFGSGSLDYVVGTSLFVTYQDFILLSSLQYGIRTEGDYDYEFGNDLIFTTGPGFYLSREGTDSIALRLALIGEFKEVDRHTGQRVSGSAISNLFVGPELIFSYGPSLAGELGVDFRTTSEDTGSTVVPDYRVRAGLSYRF